MQDYHEAEARHDAFTAAIIRYHGGAVDTDGAPTDHDEESDHG
ncbi:hypothetical protein UFOVP1360_20 [uncultured Caudovirales phage]|uniref:Uncharacterized protein n=1 Tax=uncultured Caudovirales phage TaxID=2100421 RepID=A0A6J5S2N2_9CAUD|nr:hypothetical protein UFOVP1360_20 [uncultured Caudovirales phage]